MPKIIQFCRRALVLYVNITIEFGYCIVDYVQSIHVLTVFFVRLYAFIYFFVLQILLLTQNLLFLIVEIIFR